MTVLKNYEPEYYQDSNYIMKICKESFFHGLNVVKSNKNMQEVV